MGACSDCLPYSCERPRDAHLRRTALRGCSYKTSLRGSGGPFVLYLPARSRAEQCLDPLRNTQGKGQLLTLRLDLWLQPLMEPGRHFRAPHRERQGKGQLLPLSMGL